MSAPAETAKKRKASKVVDGGQSERIAWRRGLVAQDVNARLGQRIKQHRESLGMSLTVASKVTGLPAATLSRIENNRMAPTMPTVLKLLAGLRMAWADLMSPFPPQLQESQVSTEAPGEGEHAELQGTMYTVLHTKSPLRHHFQPVILDISNKTLEDAGGLRGHAGAEFCYVLSGTLLLHFVNRAPVELSSGASALFNGEIPHAYVAKGRGMTRVLLHNAVDPLMSDPDEFARLTGLRQNVIEISP